MAQTDAPPADGAQDGAAGAIGMKPSVFVAMPAFGSINCSQTTGSLIGTALMLQANGMWAGFGHLSYPDIADLRNMWLTLWYDKLKSSHLLFVDADMAWPFELVGEMLALDKPLLGVMYPKKTLADPTYVGSLAQDQTDVPAGWKRATGIGAGLMMIRRDCVDRIIEHEPSVIDTGKNRLAGRMLSKYKVDRVIEAFAKIKNPTEYLSEDISFCRRAMNAGIEILANVRHSVTHVGQHEFTGAFEQSLIAAGLQDYGTRIPAPGEA